MSPGNLNGLLRQSRVKMEFCKSIWRKVNEGCWQGQEFQVKPRKKQHFDSYILLWFFFFFSPSPFAPSCILETFIKSCSLDRAFYLQLSVSGTERKWRSYVMEEFDIQRNLKHNLQYYFCLLDVCSVWTSGATVLCLPRATLWQTSLLLCTAEKFIQLLLSLLLALWLALPSSSIPLPVTGKQWCTVGSVLSAAGNSVLISN